MTMIDDEDTTPEDVDLIIRCKTLGRMSRQASIETTAYVIRKEPYRYIILKRLGKITVYRTAGSGRTLHLLREPFPRSLRLH